MPASIPISYPSYYIRDHFPRLRIRRCHVRGKARTTGCVRSPDKADGWPTALSVVDGKTAHACHSIVGYVLIARCNDGECAFHSDRRPAFGVWRTRGSMAAAHQARIVEVEDDVPIELVNGEEDSVWQDEQEEEEETEVRARPCERMDRSCGRRQVKVTRTPSMSLGSYVHQQLFHPALRWPNVKMVLHVAAFAVAVFGVRNYGDVLLTA